MRYIMDNPIIYSSVVTNTLPILKLYFKWKIKNLQITKYTHGKQIVILVINALDIKRVTWNYSSFIRYECIYNRIKLYHYYIF